MLVIRAEQMLELERHAFRRFRADMVERLQALWPGRAEPAALAAAVAEGVRRAQACGLAEPREVRPFIFLCFLLGERFDADPRYPWAGQILRDPARSPADRVEALVACARVVAPGEAERIFGVRER